MFEFGMLKLVILLLTGPFTEFEQKVFFFTLKYKENWQDFQISSSHPWYSTHPSLRDQGLTVHSCIGFHEWTSKKNCQLTANQALLLIFNILLQISWKIRQINFQCTAVPPSIKCSKGSSVFGKSQIPHLNMWIWKFENLNTVLHVLRKTRGSQEPVIAHLVFNLTSKVDRKWGFYK